MLQRALELADPGQKARIDGALAELDPSAAGT